MPKLKLYAQVLVADYRRLKRIEKKIKSEMHKARKLMAKIEGSSRGKGLVLGSLETRIYSQSIQTLMLLEGLLNG